MMAKKKSKLKTNILFAIKRIQLSFIILIIFSIGFIPLSIYSYIIFKYFQIYTIPLFIISPLLLYFGIVILIISQLLISGLIIKIFNIKYKTGIYDYSYINRNSFLWMLYCSLYTPCRKIIEIFPVGRLKNTYYRLIGMKIGKNSLVGGVIKDPCITTFGDNVTMGEYSIIYGHIQNYKDGKISIKEVKIGNNCIIGAGSIIMPGAILEEDVKLAAGALATQDQILDKGKTYGGIPAKELKNK